VLVALAACEATPVVTTSPSATGAAVAPEPSASIGPPPPPGHELYGFVPYWEMDDGIAAHLADTPLSTIGLFSVTHANDGSLRTTAPGYQRITGDVGRQIAREAHDRGTRVELVYTSFGEQRNRRLLRNDTLNTAVIESLVQAVGDLGLDGVNVDVEGLDPLQVANYNDFVRRLREAIVAADPDDQVSVSTSANTTGAAMAAAANQAGADRIFLMAYDYRVGASEPGATSPLDRRDGDEKDVPWSLDVYSAVGVPPEKLLLGLPLYGVTWPVAGPEIGAPSVGRGESWILRNHVDLLGDEDAIPQRDEIEAVEVYALGSDGTIGPPPLASSSPSPAESAGASGPPAGSPAASPAASPSPSAASPSRPAASASPRTSAPPSPTTGDEVTWEAVYVDSPETLAQKLELARERGLAGAGFWAIGYERGLPAYTELMRRFAKERPLP
jgi:spore germination protein YaaH